MEIAKIKHAGELFRATDEGRVLRSDGSIVTYFEPTARQQAQTIIEGCRGPFPTARDAEELVVGALRTWNDRSRNNYYQH